MDKKVCSKCGEEKPIGDFYRNQSFCKICYNIKKREERKSLIKIVDYSKLSKQEKDELKIKWGKIYEEKLNYFNSDEWKNLDYKKKLEYWRSDEWKEIKGHIEKQKESNRQYKKWKRRWDNDKFYSMKKRLSNLIRKSIKTMGYSKKSKTYEILGVEFDELKLYFESKFSEGMSWDNMGEWHIDHIIPISSAKDENEMIKLNHYTNLHPLWEIDNLKKSDKIIF